VVLTFTTKNPKTFDQRSSALKNYDPGRAQARPSFKESQEIKLAAGGTRGE
jgi:hypothetical protein